MIDTLGVDVGGVIIGHASTGSVGPDTMFFSENYLQTPAMAGAFDALRALERRFGDRIYLVSKAKEKTQEKTRRWLDHYRFHEITGITADRVFFCMERPEKHAICQRLQVTHFVDDKLEVLGYLSSVPNRYLFRPDPREVKRFSDALPLVTRVESWEELVVFLSI